MMNNRTILVPRDQFFQVRNAIAQSGVKYYPFRATPDGYYIQFRPQNHPLVSYLLLKYDINTSEGLISNDVQG